MTNTVRSLRACVVCEKPYRPTYYKQQACGRTCGVWINPQTRLVSTVQWHPCITCERQHSAPTARCAPCLASFERTPNQNAKIARRIAPVQCASCGEWFTPPNHRGWVTCSERCKRRAVRYRRKVREAGSYGEWRWSDFMRVARRFDYCCAYCGQKPDVLEPDHVRPLSRGGANVIANLLPACKPCNGQKTDRLLTEWAEYRASRGLPTLRTTWDVTDDRYFHLTATDRIRVAA